MKKLLLVFLLSCHPTPSPVDTVTAPAEASAPNPMACHQACLNLQTLRCPEGETTDGGMSCEALCQQLEDSGYFSAHATCVSDSASVADVRSCGYRCGSR